ncbi:MAG: hypothetical protein WCI02_15000 [Planctomycetota bacterium]
MATGILRPTLLILALTLVNCGACFGQDSNIVKTLASRLRTASHIGVTENEKLGGFTVIVYTNDQYKLNLEALAKYKTDLEAYQRTIAEIDKRREVAVASKASVTQLNAITDERNSHQAPYSQFGPGRVSLYRIVDVASDYLEVSGIADTDESTLIPLSKICSVRITKSPLPKSENSNDK